MSIRVFVADERPEIHARLTAAVAPLPEVVITGCAADATTATRKVQVLRPHVVLLGRLPRCHDEIPTAARIIAERPQTAVALIADQFDHIDLVRAARAGIRGCLLVSSLTSEAPRAIRVLAGGGAAVSPPIAVQLLASFRMLANQARLRQGLAATLSSRELDVLTLAGDGCTNREIGDQLALSMYTVKGHLAHILQKLNLRNRQQLAATAALAGLNSRVACPEAALR
jgi:DNA-binding NarL/FixJ family response regulator